MDKLRQYLQDHQDELDADSPRDAVWHRIQANARTTVKPSRKAVAKMFLPWVAAACVVSAGLFFGIRYIAGGDAIKEDGIATAKTILPMDSLMMRQNESITRPPKPTPEILVKQDAPNKKIVPTRQDRTVLTTKKTRPALIAYTPTKNHKHMSVSDLQENQAVAEIEHSYARLVDLQLDRLRMTPVFAEGPNYFNDFKTQLRQMDADEARIRKDLKTRGMSDELLEQLINVSQQRLNLLKDLQLQINKMNNKVRQHQLPSDSTSSYFINI